MQGLVVVGLIFEEIPNINIKCVKVTGVHNKGQGHQVKVPAESVHREEVLYKVWWLKALQLRTYGRVTICVKVSGARNIGQGQPVKVPAESVH